MEVSPTKAATTTGGGSSSNNVLSDKVNRALHVRTDTPAMRTALDALANLPSDDNDTRLSISVGNKHHGSSSGGGEGSVIDARSVRAAIEKDALRRALEFQKELQKLACDATTLRERVDNVAKVAALVGKRVESQIVDVASSSENTIEAMGGDSSGDHFGTTNTAPAANAWEEERNLATRLAYAQRSYVEATKRQVAVDAFLDKFDLGDDEAALLDFYNFEGFVTSEYSGLGMDEESNNPWSHPAAALNVVPNPSQGAIEEAMAFLNALERLTVIRKELTKAFGSGTSDLSDGSSEYGHASMMDDSGVGGGGGQLGTHSALRMMEHLASRQERAHERL